MAATRNVRDGAKPKSPAEKMDAGYLNRSSNKDSKKLISVADLAVTLVSLAQFSVAHRVEDDVDPHLVRVGREAQRIVRVLRPFPGVSQIAVEVDRYEQPVLVIQDPLDHRNVAVLLPRRAARLGLDYGEQDVLKRYERWRRFDSFAMAAATDGVNRLFSNDLPPLRLARDMGLGIVDQIAPLRRFFMRHAGGDIGRLPKLLKGEAA